MTLESRLRIIRQPEQFAPPRDYHFVQVALQQHLFAIIGQYPRDSKFLLVRDRDGRYTVYVK
ncbi:hypothetical protein HY639_01375 [Candidatus Woesearchaeota archaeon]|nr:hypothetical protein [Candidatus Woesearchaeota archaeon]